MLCRSFLKSKWRFCQSVFQEKPLWAFTNINKPGWQMSTGAEVVMQGYSQPLAANERCCKGNVSRNDLSAIPNQLSLLLLVLGIEKESSPCLPSPLLWNWRKKETSLLNLLPFSHSSQQCVGIDLWVDVGEQGMFLCRTECYGKVSLLPHVSQEVRKQI